MSWIDIIVLVPLAWFGFRGLKNGLIKEVASLFAIFVGGWAAIRFSPSIADEFGGSLTVNVVTFILLFFAILIGVHFIALFIAKIIKLVIPSFLDNILGLLFGALKVLLVAGVFFVFVAKIDQNARFIKEDTRQNSFFFKNVEPFAADLYSFVKDTQDDKK
ncbi:MAG: CvpA family protein [Bacteroidales bacterium]|nr:CvpA family protein [Bacteroidales bacterium]